MKVKALREKSIVELQVELKALLRELFNLRMQRGSSDGSGTAVRPHLFKEVRRNVARVKTIIHEKVANNSDNK